MKTLFISDLHLSAKRPDLTDLFFHFLENHAEPADQLFILGDFFEYWVGPDVLNHHEIEIINTLKNYTKKGKKIYFMHGNRDFLIDKEFEFYSGAKIIPEPYILDNISQTKWVLCHGDALCTLDTPYQRFRKIVRHPMSKSFFLSLPAYLRKKIAKKLRSQSKHFKQKYNKNPEMWDVTSDEVSNILKKYDSTILLHGHTHRLGLHDLLIENKPHKRIVLGDWDTTGNFLEVQHDQFKLFEFDKEKHWEIN